MKTILPVSQFVLKTLLFFVIVTTAKSAYAQPVPELVFNNPVIKSGIDGQDGTIYRFSNVASGIDAEVKIVSRSGNGVVLTNIDTTGTGYDKAFQPVVGIPGTVPANMNWQMNFNLTFFESGTTKKTKLARFNVAGYDFDGDGIGLSEWVQMNRASAVELQESSTLNYTILNSYGSEADYKVSGTTFNLPGINIAEMNAMALFTYRYKDSFDFSIGAQTNAASSAEGMRTVSFLMKQFSMFTLPVKLVSFSAVLNNFKTELAWKTSAEMNLSHFLIEKSVNGINYTSAGLVRANGSQSVSTSYTFSDPLVAEQDVIVYYRLRSVDLDGRSELSETRIIRVNKKSQNAFLVTAYPNPVINELRVTIPAGWQGKKSVYEVITFSGQIVQRMESANSSQTELLNVNSLTAGLYILRVSCEGQTAKQQIMKN
ncbi:MAG: T9SS type A sorting domain-containing protein [Chitinophagaceae bacterium]